MEAVLPENPLVLAVDDDLVICQLLARVLKNAGYEVVSARNGREALEFFQQEPAFCLVISDLNMPVMNGHELLREIRADGSDIPVIVLSANNEIAIALDTLNNGANDYVPKDQNLRKTLMISVERVMERRRLEMKNRQLMEDIARKNRQFENELLLAQKVQENILPLNLNLPGFLTGTFYRATNQVGGDFFDALDCGDLVHVLIGDISGHNTSSALLMAVCKGMFASLGRSMSDPREIVAAANRMLCPILMGNGMFLTLVYAVLDRASGQVRIVSAGHNPVYIITATSLTEISSGGPVIGWDADDTWNEELHCLEPGDSLFLYTDGLVESRNSAGTPFEELLTGRLRAHNETPDKLTARLVTELTEFTGGDFDDDITLFTIMRASHHV